MAHLKAQKKKLLARVDRLQGQLRGLRRSIDEDEPCGEVLHTLAAFRGAINGLMLELLEDHIRHHVVEPDEDGHGPEEGAEELIVALRKYLK